MTIQQAIEKAIDGGYQGKILDYFLNHDNKVIDTTNHDVLGTLLLDPLFWQSLSRAMGKENVFDEHRQPHRKDSGLPEGSTFQWRHCKKMMHDFVDHLFEGKKPESFFKSL